MIQGKSHSGNSSNWFPRETGWAKIARTHWLAQELEPKPDEILLRINITPPMNNPDQTFASSIQEKLEKQNA